MKNRIKMFLKFLFHKPKDAIYVFLNGLFYKKIIKIKIRGKDFYQNNDDATLYHLINSTTKLERMVDILPNDLNGDIIDAGANNGLFSFLASNKFPKTKIYSIEPSITLQSILKKNFSGLNISLHQCALSEQDGFITLYTSKNSDQIGSIIIDNVKAFEKNDSNIISSKVEAYSIDTFILKNNITKIAVLKIDIQGAEFEILQNSKQLFCITEIVIIEMMFIETTIFKLIDLMKNHFKYYAVINPVSYGADILFSKNNIEGSTLINK